VPSARVKKQRGTRFSANHTPRYLAFLKLFRQARADAGMTQREVAREFFDPDADGKGPRRRLSAGSRTPPSASS
jgi:hypothetical protein